MDSSSHERELVNLQLQIMQATLDRMERVWRESNERDAAREAMFWKRLEKVQADKLDVARLRGESQRELISLILPYLAPLVTEYLSNMNAGQRPVDTCPPYPGESNVDPFEPSSTPPVAGEAPSSTAPPFEEA
jgi:hypothetical protein